MKKLSIIVPSLDGAVPSLPSNPCVETIVIRGVSPVSAARNEGLSRATGEYVAWVDADDEIGEEWLSSILLGLAANPDVLSFNARVVWSDGKRPSYTIGSPAYAADVMAERTNGQLWNKVIKRELYEGIIFKGAAHEDYMALCELLPRASTFAHLDKELYVYRRSVSGLSQYGDVDLALNAILELIEFCADVPTEWSRDIKKGVAQRVADFCRNAESSLELRRFIRKALPLIFFDAGLSMRTKIKCLLAGLGV